MNGMPLLVQFFPHLLSNLLSLLCSVHLSACSLTILNCFWIWWRQSHDVKSRNDAMLARSNYIKILHSFRLCYIWYMCDQYYAFIAIQHFIYVSTTKTTWKKNSPNCFTKKFHNARVIKKCGRNICREKTLPRTCISSFIPIVPNAIFECYSHVANF